ncbi:F-box protein 9 [Kwoniella heveanensis BCC8398]|uniref:F-box protein 9 n=1 Tax=Kwoniella heveanensis BCC8398 TaxID=1296120 RepID=A0A1B9GI50_9TREE|nr:F-box protein 9 [Kwoniella heveanensis BCC8398]
MTGTPTIDSRSSTPDVDEEYEVDIEGEGEGEEVSGGGASTEAGDKVGDEVEIMPNLAKLALSSTSDFASSTDARTTSTRLENSEREEHGVDEDDDTHKASGIRNGGGPAPVPNDEDELERFRAQWRAEVKSKAGSTSSAKSGKPPGIGNSVTNGGGVQVGPVRWKEREHERDGNVEAYAGDAGMKVDVDPGSNTSTGLDLGKDTDRVIEIQKGKDRAVAAENSSLADNHNHRRQPTTRSTKIRSPVKSTAKLPASPISPKKALQNTQRSFQDADGDGDDDGFGPLTSASTFSAAKGNQSSAAAAGKPIRYQGSIVPPGSSSGQTNGASTNPRLSDEERAVQMYAKAVESEQSGKLNDALLLYRRAFKLNDDVDRAYARSIAKTHPNTNSTTNDKSSAQALVPPTPTSADIISPTPPSIEPYSFARHIQLDPDYEKSHPIPDQSATPTPQAPPQNRSAKTRNHPDPVFPPSPLTALLSSLPTPPQELTFLQADEELPTPISKLPPELIEPILFHLDVTSIERFGSTCWRARYLTHISLVWRRILEKIYRPPAMLPTGEQIVGNGFSNDVNGAYGSNEREAVEEDQSKRREKKIEVKDLVKRHHGEWRTTFIEEERIRMDGCYIAVCHYIRPGAGEEWVTITHMITYHRFLRFYPDGNVISFLTTDHPSEIVPVLRPSIRGKGLHFGRWKLIRTDSPVHPSNNPDSEVDANTNTDKMRKNARVLITDLLEPGVEGPKYEFEMELALRSTGRGRWNKLEIIEYRSINLLTGEVLALALKHQKPFYFSKVRSYNPPL